MSIALKRLGALVMAAILIAGMAPAMKTEAASTALAKPGNCRFVRWREKDVVDDHCRFCFFELFFDLFDHSSFDLQIFY